ncbi:universal stress protein (plasmid) [Leisingera caerulea]|uniref:Universal stress protein n=1 Tax=Leisingera caerulea TaxID=506591 RepID=A0A9Q9M0F3_LEICA|nr:universal stress protein [Leisingera caerulea]UWQ51983.1 universal stress protein [Leisingera caerulea]UWQ56211.1 universal stress protein [Leisingera caerulea]UWQ60920.1 universal stress protein [Leisingera caerulea]UWQ64896.1 universal stress protein [Leisingera caerulea]UWQ85869.1 universal stress protein [Leisingera caerulea]
MKPMITSILFATDLSHNSTLALRHAASLAHATGAEIHVLHVNEPISEDARITFEMFVLNEETRKSAARRRHEMVKQILAERQARFWASFEGDEAKIRDQVTSVEVTDGHPAEVILRRSVELGCDLIVLGAHDHGFSHTFLGTVAKRVLRRSQIPTLVVPYQNGEDED